MAFEVSNERSAFHRSRESESFTDDILTLDRFLRKRSIGIQHQLDRLRKIAPRLVKRSSLGIGPRQFLDEADVPFRHALKYRRELHVCCPR